MMSIWTDCQSLFGEDALFFSSSLFVMRQVSTAMPPRRPILARAIPSSGTDPSVHAKVHDETGSLVEVVGVAGRV
jgi:hypothetical protein